MILLPSTDPLKFSRVLIYLQKEKVDARSNPIND